MEWRYVGSYAGSLASGRPLEPGESVNLSEEEEKDPFNKSLIEDGKLLPIDKPSGAKKGGE